MHELSICTAIADIVRRHAGARRVVSVRVQVGQLRQVVPEALDFCWPAVCQGAQLAGATLEIEHVPAAVECPDCQRRSAVASQFACCPACDSPRATIVAGEECFVESIELSDAAEPPEE